MIIDAKKLNGLCSCGKVHEMFTEFAVVESGALKKFDEYRQKYSLVGKTTAIYDENTYIATKDRHVNATNEIILPQKNLHANEKGVQAVLDNYPSDTQVLVAVGSGTIHDITRYVAHLKGVPFIACPTAASVDGFCSSVAAMTWEGCKKTFPAVAPKIVIADTDVIANAPLEMAKSGFGDMIGKYISLADWKIANVVTGEYICPRISDMTMQATTTVLEIADKLKNGEKDGFEKLAYGLILSGLAMQLSGNSRPASAAEHHISHLIEMQPQGLNVNSDAMHGEKVGVATIILSGVYHKIANSKVEFVDYMPYTEEFVHKMFGDELTRQIMQENVGDTAIGLTKEKLANCFEQIKNIISEIPTQEKLIQIYDNLGVKKSLADIDVADNKLDLILEYAPCVRTRLTLLRLKKAIKIVG